MPTTRCRCDKSDTQEMTGVVGLYLGPKPGRQEPLLTDIQASDTWIAPIRVQLLVGIPEVPHVYALVCTCGGHVPAAAIHRNCEHRPKVTLHANRRGAKIGRPHGDPAIAMPQADGGVPWIRPHHSQRPQLRLVLCYDLPMGRVLIA